MVKSCLNKKDTLSFQICSCFGVVVCVASRCVVLALILRSCMFLIYM